MFTGYANQIREVETFLSRLPFASDYSVAMTVYDKRDFGLVDVIAPGCSKGATLAEWVRRRGWSRDDVMAIGDNLNDLEMLQYAGLPVVMGNSVPELKTLGWRETLSNDQGGVAAAIDYMRIEMRELKLVPSLWRDGSSARSLRSPRSHRVRAPIMLSCKPASGSM